MLRLSNNDMNRGSRDKAQQELFFSTEGAAFMSGHSIFRAARRSGSQLSVVELSIRKIGLENELKKIPNAETGNPRKGK
jgi:hypothetical protein